MSLIIFLVVLGLVAYLITFIPMDASIAQIIRVVFIVVAIIAVLKFLVGGSFDVPLHL